MTLYTSDKAPNENMKKALKYLLIACGVGIAGAIYEVFGHGVWSGHMVYAFAFPLLLGCLPNLVLAVYRPQEVVSVAVRDFWGAGIAALTVGSVFQGVLSIYGTTSNLVLVYPLVGVMLLIAGGLLFLRRSDTPQHGPDACSTDRK